MKGKRILLIDDDPICNFVSKLTLKNFKKDVEVTESLSGKEGLEILNELNEKNKKPDVILLDINMPNMNGWEFIEELRKNGLNSIPIVILTSSTYESDKLKAKKYEEVVDYLIKPLKNEELSSLKV